MYKTLKFIVKIPYQNFSTYYLFNKNEKILLPIEIDGKIESPSIHDSLIRIIKGTGYSIVGIKIYYHKENTFYTYLTIKNSKNIFDININLIDGLEICKKSSTPIFINEKILRSCGIEITKDLVLKALNS